MKRTVLILASLCAVTAYPAGALAARHIIEIKDMRFGRAPNGSHVGDVIVWKNSDIVRHTATAKNSAFDLMLEPGQSRSITVKKTGHIEVFCRYHPEMTLELTVEQ